MVKNPKNTGRKINKMSQKKGEIEGYAPRFSGFITLLLTFFADMPREGN
jgi:hypothetical protein